MDRAVSPSTPSAARALLARSLVWDNHGCMPVGRPLDTSFLPQLQRYRSAGVNAVMLNVGFGDMSIEAHLRTLASIRHWIKSRPNDYTLIQGVTDVEQARANGRLAVGFDLEGANAIGDQLSLIELYYDLGVRWMLFAYINNHCVGGCCQFNDPGLSGYGREVLAEMERVGMQVCCSHTGHRTTRDVLAAATKPVIFSHSNPAALHAHPRNIPDELIRACAASGGVVGINGIGTFLGNNDSSSENFARHVDHVVQLVGSQHVALGLDYVFDTQELLDYLKTMQHTFPPGLGYDNDIRMVTPEQIEGIVQILLARGYAEQDLQNVLGANLLRVARQVWE